MSEDGKAITIIFIQTIFGTEPHKSLVVLENTKHCILGKTLLG
jgi:hypothetical protein